LIGKSLAHDDVTGLLGKGGMGEVYRANDTKLGREVALKLLPPELANDPERLARFRREVRTLASLHNAHIASLFGIEEIKGTPEFLFSLNLNSQNAAYDSSRDGQQILTNEMPETNRDQVGARLIQNWAELLRR